MENAPYTIESKDEEIVVRIPRTAENERIVSRVLDYFDFEATRAKSKATDQEIEELANDVSQAAWNRFRQMFGAALESSK